tara:strand:+ start:183036 stop:183266 length:231 start_codon:yes stop_codon:yes gene_type:complete
VVLAFEAVFTHPRARLQEGKRIFANSFVFFRSSRVMHPGYSTSLAIGVGVRSLHDAAVYWARTSLSAPVSLRDPNA